MSTTRTVASIVLASLLISACNSTMDIDKLYEKMSLEEKVAQLHGLYLEEFFTADGKLNEELCAEKLSNGAGHFSQFAFNTAANPNIVRDRVAAMQNWLKKNTRLGIPALFHEEILTGVNAYGATVYPQQIGLACSFDTELAKKKTKQSAARLRQVGGHLALSPMVDVVRMPSFNRLEESYGEDGFLSARMGVAFVKGLQGSDLSKAGVAACTKHFLGYGGGADTPNKELIEDIAQPHRAIIKEAGSQVLMTGYHSFRGLKCVANSQLQGAILRDSLNFTGMTVSDYDSIGQIEGEYSDLEKAILAFNAGNDVDFPNGKNYQYLVEAVQKGLVSECRLEEAVKHVLRLKANLGLLNTKPVLYDKGYIEWDSKEERETAYKLASESVVLLKNDGVLPIKEPKCRIALVGPNAHTMWSMLGDYTYHSMSYFWKQHTTDAMHPVIVTLKDGMEAKLPEGYTLSYERGCEWTEVVETVLEKGGDPRTQYMNMIQNRMVKSEEKADLSKALQIAQNSDVIVVAVGENVILCGENRDRTSLRLPGKQEEFVSKLLNTGKPVVMVVFGGRAQVISSLADRCAAIIQAWYPGEEGGNALADILYGNISPSGKLSVSYPNTEIYDEAICYSYGKEDKRIEWPFGYGLSYSNFEYSNLKIGGTKDYEVELMVKNTGDMKASEVVQLYVSPTNKEQNYSPIKLQGFARVDLEPNESKKVKIQLKSEQFGYYKDDWSFIPASGKYIIKVGASSKDIRLVGEIDF